VINEYMNRLGFYPNDRLRDVLYNIEQFKFDALIQPELSMRSPPSSHSNSSTESSTNSSSAKSRSASKKNPQSSVNNSMSKKMIKDGDKSSGTNNLIGNGSGSTLTGKNSYAVLKASSIAAS